MKTLKVLILTIIMVNLFSEGLFFYDTVIYYFLLLLFVIISPYQRNTIQTLLFKLFDKLIRLELVKDS